MKFSILSFIFSLLLTLLLASSQAKNPNEERLYSVRRLESRIQIDGIIDTQWAQADSITQFFQLQPYIGKPPLHQTIAKVLTTSDALYCLMICHAKPEQVQRITGRLDEGEGDVVSIMLDTFGDKRTAYKFAVSAGGVRSDCRLLDDARQRDYSWDGVWFAAAQMYSWGYVVEMEIPYKSIQYDETLSEWGLDFDRWSNTTHEDLYWCEYQENEGQRISKFGTLKFDQFRPSIKGLNLEIYPVAIARTSLLHDSKYKFDPDAGIDVLYNPSQKLTFQLTVNPDFAQIEADPYSFNISRYESYFSERRPFFTQGNEVFLPAGRQRNTGFYQPLELFYSRRIGRKLPDGKEVPLIAGTKVFGRIDDWEYGGFFSVTRETDYLRNGETATEPQALFAAGRVKKQILENSSVGVLFVGKQTSDRTNAVLDIDGALRGSDWQLAYQFARSVKGATGDYAASLGFSTFKESWFAQARGRFIGNRFDIKEIGFVPWIGTSQLTALGGPRWYFKEGAVRAALLYTGFFSYYEHDDLYTDNGLFIGGNLNFRTNWGGEVTFSYGRSKDSDVRYIAYELSASTWFNMDPKWSANLWVNYSRGYNFVRQYLAPILQSGLYFSWTALDILSLGTSADFIIEGNPENKIAEITLNTRPFASLTPINDLNIRLYFDNLYFRSTGNLEQFIVGFLFSYNFLPKSWVYFAINEIEQRAAQFDAQGKQVNSAFRVLDRVNVVKLKYLYYF